MTSPDPTGGRERVLARAEARAFYDRLGSWLDTQSFYENAALSALVAHGRIDAAHSVFEFGCGIGRLTARLLSKVLPPDAHYVGVDLSSTMVRLATGHLRPWAGRAEIRLTDGSPASGDPAGACDRFVSTYVMDLLAEQDMREVLLEAHRLLSQDGLVCLVSLACGERGLSRLVTALWKRVHALHPRLVGGCRPIRLRVCLAEDRWRVEHNETIVSLGVTSEVVVAAKSQPLPTSSRRLGTARCARPSCGIA